MNPSAMEKDELEFVILFDGIDEMTSTALQARHSYFPEDIRWNHRFVGILHRGPTGAITVDWEHFHSVVEQELATYYRV
jgi:inward rectifier potassium channel